MPYNEITPENLALACAADAKSEAEKLRAELAKIKRRLNRLEALDPERNRDA